MAEKKIKVLGKEKPPPEPGAVATSKLKKLPQKAKPFKTTPQRGKT